MTKSYVHNGKEVAPTGRTAVRRSSRGREYVLYEIKPVDMEDNNPNFCTWVQLDELFHIQENINNDDTETSSE